MKDRLLDAVANVIVFSVVVGSVAFVVTSIVALILPYLVDHLELTTGMLFFATIFAAFAWAVNRLGNK